MTYARVAGSVPTKPAQALGPDGKKFNRFFRIEHFQSVNTVLIYVNVKITSLRLLSVNKQPANQQKDRERNRQAGKTRDGAEEEIRVAQARCPAG